MNDHRDSIVAVSSVDYLGETFQWHHARGFGMMAWGASFVVRHVE
jgi:uncharacterized protein (DUF486 family)